MKKAVVCDLDGVVYLGAEPVPGAHQALASIAAAGVQLVFCTNNSTRTASEAAAKIRSVVGYPAEPAQIVTSAMAATHLLAGQVANAHVVGGRGIREAMTGAGIEVVDAGAAQAVVVGLDLTVTYERLRDAALAVRRGARFVATNTDGSYPTPTGQWPGAGALVAAIAAASDRTPEVAGKPHAPMIELLRDRIGDAIDVVVVGDRAETDLALGRAAGWRTVLTLTGVVDGLSDVAPEHEPDAVTASIADLPRLLANEFQWEVMSAEPSHQPRS